MVLGMQGLGLFLVVMLMWIVVPGCGGGGGDNPPQTGGGNVSQIEIKDLGPPIRLAAGARTGPISVDIPAGTASVMFIADGGNTTADIDIEDLINPTGSLLVGRRSTFMDPGGKNQFHVANDSLASGVLWGGSQSTIPAGTYKFQVASYNEPATVQVRAIFNRRANPTGGTLDVNLIFCGVPGLNTDNALADPAFQVLFNEFKRIYAQANIQVKVAGIFNCNDASELAVLETEDEFRVLLTQSSIVGNQAMNFFFVQQFEPPGFPLGLIGRAGKIEGPALLQGTPYSGVVIAATTTAGFSALSQAELLNQGATMAHEGGHFLGLYHTTERCGAGATECEGGFDMNENGQIDAWELVDSIQDTPECPSIRRFSNPPDFVSISRDGCSDLDGKNLMFPLRVTPSDNMFQDQLTADQQSVLQYNPYVH